MKDSVARSISIKLSRLARERGIVFERLLTLFFLERMLERVVSHTTLSSVLIFKGGYVQNRIYGSPRFTVDLDATLRGDLLRTIEKDLISAIEANIYDGIWFRFESRTILELQNDYGGVRFSFRTGLGAMPKEFRIAQLVNFDLGVGDAVAPENVRTEGLLGDREFSWRIYPVEFIAAEKLHAALTRPLENSRAKDIFDLSFLLPKCNAHELKKAVSLTFRNRGDMPPDNIKTAFSSISTTRLRIGWGSAVKGIHSSPNFEHCFQEILAHLSRMYEVE